MGKTFRNIVLCSTDDFPFGENDKIKGWIEHNGGKFSKDITSEVTHLVTTKAAFQKNEGLVKEAKEYHKIKIVTLDWLKDSLLRLNRRPLKTADYELGLLKTQRRVRKQAVRRAVAESPSATLQELDKLPNPEPKTGLAKGSTEGMDSASAKSRLSHGCAQNVKLEERIAARLTQIDAYGLSLDTESSKFENEMFNNGYHIYRDPTGFQYSLNLVRRDILGKCLDRHLLKVRYAPTPFSPSPPAFPMRGISHPQPHPSPHALFYFPHSSPFSAWPAISCQLPRHLRQGHNRALRVHIFNPWAQCVQLFESDNPIPTSADCKFQARRYAALTTYLHRSGYVQTMEIAPMGSTWATVTLCFKNFFKNRCQVEWDERPGFGEWSQTDTNSTRSTDRYVYEAPQSENEPKGLRQLPQKPSMTMVLDEESAASVIDARAPTPEFGW